MSIFKRRLENEKTEKEIAALQRDLRVIKFEMQGYIDALTGEESSNTYGLNNYRDYQRAIAAINTKYENSAPWGNGLTANIIDFRAAVAISSGPQYKPAERATLRQRDEEGAEIGSGEGPGEEIESEKEMEFVRAFFEFNDINHETPQEWGREGEMEGRFAVGLSWDDVQKQVIATHYPWIKYQYEEVRDPKNPREIIEIRWADRGTGVNAGSLKGDELVCRRLSGRQSAKYPVTKIMRCLTQIEYIDQAFRDWREINRLYAAPVPDFAFKTPEEAEDFDAAFKKNVNWKIKKAFIHSGEFNYKGPDMSGIASLESEIKRQACFIAGTTGYPLQFLLPDMLANRSTSENIMESALIHTASERQIWTGFYEELVSKAMALYALKSSKTKLDPNKISISISLMTKEQWDRLASFWLPAFEKDLVTREAVLPMIPDFNVREEMERRESADESKVAQITAELDKAQAEAENNQQQQQPPPPPPVAGQFKKKPKAGEEKDNEL